MKICVRTKVYLFNFLFLAYSNFQNPSSQSKKHTETRGAHIWNTEHERYVRHHASHVSHENKYLIGSNMHTFRTWSTLTCVYCARVQKIQHKQEESGENAKNNNKKTKIFDGILEPRCRKASLLNSSRALCFFFGSHFRNFCVIAETLSTRGLLFLSDLLHADGFKRETKDQTSALVGRKTVLSVCVCEKLQNRAPSKSAPPMCFMAVFVARNTKDSSLCEYRLFSFLCLNAGVAFTRMGQQGTQSKRYWYFSFVATRQDVLECTCFHAYMGVVRVCLTNFFKSTQNLGQYTTNILYFWPCLSAIMCMCLYRMRYSLYVHICVPCTAWDFSFKGSIGIGSQLGNVAQSKSCMAPLGLLTPSGHY